MIRKGASGTFYDKGLDGASHHAVIPNVNTIDKLREGGNLIDTMQNAWRFVDDEVLRERLREAKGIGTLDA
jgi:hypothetical protein